MFEELEHKIEQDGPDYEGKLALSKLKIDDDLSRMFFEMAGQLDRVYAAVS